MQSTDAPAEEASRARRLKSAVRIVGIAVAIVAVVLCVRALVSEWSTVRPALRHMKAWPAIVALLCSAGSMAGLGLLWWRCLHLFGSPARAVDAVSWYFGGELGKYLPGGIWQVLGRGELAQRKGGISRGSAYATTLISYGAMSVGAALVCGVLAPFAAQGGASLGWWWAMFALVPVGLLAIHPVVFDRILATARRLTHNRLDLPTQSWGGMIRLVAWSMPTWFLLGLAAVLSCESLGFHQHPARVAFAAVAAWIIGFLAVPVPAGAGIRELVFIGVSGLGLGPGAAVAAAARILLIVVDGVGGVLGLMWTRRDVTEAEPL